jgi:hypothetical protein
VRHAGHQAAQRSQFFLAHQFDLRLLQLGQRGVQGRVLRFQEDGALVDGALEPVDTLQALQRHRRVVGDHAEQRLVLIATGMLGGIALDHDRAQWQVLLVEQRTTDPVFGGAAGTVIQARAEVFRRHHQGLAVLQTQAVGDSSGGTKGTGWFSGGPSSDSSTKYTKRTVPSSRSDRAT